MNLIDLVDLDFDQMGILEEFSIDPSPLIPWKDSFVENLDQSALTLNELELQQ